MPDAPSAADVRDRRKEADMDKQKYTILYERLSRDDGEDSVSNSIKNQCAMLEEYADRNGLVPFLHIQDDGYSGTNWNRPGWREVEQKIEADEVSALVIKDAYVKLRINFFGLNFVNILRAILEKEKSTVHCWGIVLFSCN